MIIVIKFINIVFRYYSIIKVEVGSMSNLYKKNDADVKERGAYGRKNEDCKINEIKINYIFHPRIRSEKTIRMIY